MPTKKIADLPVFPDRTRSCRDPDHRPSEVGLQPGIYNHTCAACGDQVRFRVDPLNILASLTPTEAFTRALSLPPQLSSLYGPSPQERLQRLAARPPKNRNPDPGHVLFDSTSFRVSGWIAEATGIGYALRDKATTCAEAKVLLRRRTEIINAWCTATQANDVPGGPFEHNLCLCGGDGDKLQWVVNGDVVSEIPPAAGPAAAARAWVQQSTGGKHVDV